MNKPIFHSIITCLLAMTVFSFNSCSEQPQTASTEPALETGVSEGLATYRQQVISKLAYTINLEIPADKDEPVPGSESIRFNLLENRFPLQLDFKEGSDHLKQLRVNGTDIPVDHRQEHIIIPARFLQQGENLVEIDFVAGDLSLNRNEDYLYTLLVPDRARTLFPVFDQPDLKATFQLSLTVPHDWKALANAPLADSVVQDSRKTYHFAVSDTISTYLFSFAAGRFDKLSREVDGTAMHFYHRETDEEKIRLSVEPVFRIHANALRFMEDYTAIPYPFQKFDFIALPDFQYGGMEHVGAIDYKASTLFLDSGATRDQHISRANLIAHETAHMWFGDLVTMRWFNDVWMKEVFANFMADKITQVSLEDTNYDLKFLIDHFPAAYGVDRTAGANPIRQPLDNLQDAGSLYGSIIYHKAPVMMRQLERLMGEAHFQQGLQEYLHKYAHGNASWPELIAILDEGTETDLQAWNQVWVNEPGRPVFDWEMETEEGKISRFLIRQQAEDGSERLWPQRFELALVYPDSIRELSVEMDASAIALEEAIGAASPLFVLFNTSGQGYGVFPQDKEMGEQLFRTEDPVARAAAYINLYENMLNGRYITPGELLQFLRTGLHLEKEELNLKLLTGYLTDIYWRLLPAEERSRIASQLERELWSAMEEQTAPNAKKLLFNAYRTIAMSKGAQDRLYRIWENRAAPAGVRLNEDDYTSLALALAVRDYPADRVILEEQLTRVENPDRQKRLQFMIPALSEDKQERDAFFASLKEPRNREKESWVLAALSYLHHPLRRTDSEQYLPESLALLAEIQQTGDIFFPHGWLQSSFSPYVSVQAAQMVRDFLEQHPDFNPKLRAKILQAADPLFRAEKLLSQEDDSL